MQARKAANPAQWTHLEQLVRSKLHSLFTQDPELAPFHLETTFSECSRIAQNHMDIRIHVKSDYEKLLHDKAMSNWQQELDEIAAENGTAKVYVENRVDLVPPPADFQYVSSNVYTDLRVNVELQPIMGCECESEECGVGE